MHYKESSLGYKKGGIEGNWCGFSNFEVRTIGNFGNSSTSYYGLLIMLRKTTKLSKKNLKLLLFFSSIDLFIFTFQMVLHNPLVKTRRRFLRTNLICRVVLIVYNLCMI